MAEQSNPGTWLGVGLGLGIIIGGFFTFLIYNARQQVTQPVLTQQPVIQQPPVYQPPPINVFPVIREENIPRVLERNAAPEIPKIQAPHPEPVTAIATTYKNNEKWAIERGDDGLITSLNVVRDARVNASS